MIYFCFLNWSLPEHTQTLGYMGWNCYVMVKVATPIGTLSKVGITQADQQRLHHYERFKNFRKYVHLPLATCFIMASNLMVLTKRVLSQFSWKFLPNSSEILFFLTAFPIAKHKYLIIVYALWRSSMLQPPSKIFLENVVLTSINDRNSTENPFLAFFFAEQLGICERIHLFVSPL